MGDIWYNLIILICAYLYVFMVVGIGIFIQKKTNKSSEFTRKTIHVLAGFVVYSVFLFTPDFAWLAIIIAVTFVILLWASGPNGPEFMKAMFDSMARTDDIEEGKIYGPLYYAISITILTIIFTFPLFDLIDFYWIPASTLSIMYLGDGIAPFIGKKFGRHQYGPNNRTIIGSLAVFILGVIGCLLTMFTAFTLTNAGISSQYLTINILTPVVSVITASVFTILEAITPKGFDNITCPLTSTVILALISPWVLPTVVALFP
ncbi:MAG: diacylglycerol/polyprenol kinase family protein [Candidatus Hodarchaeota archaeon]